MTGVGVVIDFVQERDKEEEEEEDLCQDLSLMEVASMAST